MATATAVETWTHREIPRGPSRAWTALLGVMAQLGLLFAAALAYFGVRGLTEGSESVAISNGRDLLRFEHLLRVDFEQSLQGWILDHRVVVTAANWVYIWGHWPVIIATFVWLYRVHRPSYLLLRNAMFISGAIGLAIFVLLPVAPPRLMPGGFVDTVTELSTSYRVLQPPALVNKFAAVPSLHVGWNLLVGIIVFRSFGNPLARTAALASPILMSVAVVLTANHYVIDAVLGSVVAFVGLTVATLWACHEAVVGGGAAGDPDQVSAVLVDLSAPESTPCNQMQRPARPQFCDRRVSNTASR